MSLTVFYGLVFPFCSRNVSRADAGGHLPMDIILAPTNLGLSPLYAGLNPEHGVRRRC